MTETYTFSRTRKVGECEIEEYVSLELINGGFSVLFEKTVNCNSKVCAGEKPTKISVLARIADNEIAEMLARDVDADIVMNKVIEKIAEVVKK